MAILLSLGAPVAPAAGMVEIIDGPVLSIGPPGGGSILAHDT